jgi:hypothetical protein
MGDPPTPMSSSAAAPRSACRPAAHCCQSVCVAVDTRALGWADELASFHTARGGGTWNWMDMPGAAPCGTATVRTSPHGVLTGTGCPGISPNGIVTCRPRRLSERGLSRRQLRPLAPPARCRIDWSRPPHPLPQFGSGCACRAARRPEPAPCKGCVSARPFLVYPQPGRPAPQDTRMETFRPLGVETCTGRCEILVYPHHPCVSVRPRAGRARRGRGRGRRGRGASAARQTCTICPPTTPHGIAISIMTNRAPPPPVAGWAPPG